MNKNMRRALCALALAGTLTLCGCQKAENDGAQSIAVVRDDTGSEYRLVEVRSGDISLTESIRAKYFAAREESYGFGESSLYYDAFEVSVGDEVKAGDVLATLDAGELNLRIAECEAAKEEANRVLERNRELAELYHARMEGRTPDEADRARIRAYETAVRDAEDEISVLEAELAELNAQKENRVIVSGIDGTVTFVRAVENGETSVKGKAMITVTDLTSCAFTAEVEHPQALKEDEVYTVKVGGEACEIRLTTAEELGVESAPMNEKSMLTRVYFALLTPSVNLTSDSTGTFSVEVESREGVPYIPATAVTKIDGKTCVYVPDECGLCAVREVEVGLVTQRYAEILSGLEVGEHVIQF